MKFIKLRHGKDETRTYTVNVDNIACIETYIDNSGKVYTWITGHGLENGQLYVKETKEQILKVLQKIDFAKSFSKYVV